MLQQIDLGQANLKESSRGFYGNSFGASSLHTNSVLPFYHHTAEIERIVNLHCLWMNRCMCGFFSLTTGSLLRTALFCGGTTEML